MKQLLTILLFCILLVQTCSKLVIFVNYEINKKQITEQYCVNKNNPMAHCDGMCHMIKQLQKEEKQESTPVKTQNERIEIVLFSQREEGQDFRMYITGDFMYATVKAGKISSRASSIFHPPSC